MVNPESPSEVLEIVTLRSKEWIEETGCAAGVVIPFELEEMGVSGFAEIISVSPCPKIAWGDGRVVLSTITHLNSDVRVLRLENEDISLELTGSHRLFSVDRSEWIATRDLKPGETLATQRGEVVIESVERKSGAHRVFNIEVESEHCYFVGSSSVLSHNENPCEAPTSRTKWGKEHGKGNVEHNNAIEDLLDDAESRGASDLRKNRVQRDAEGKRVYSDDGKYTRPDGSYVEDGARHNYNRVSNSNDLDREIEAFQRMIEADPNAVNSLEF